MSIFAPLKSVGRFNLLYVMAVDAEYGDHLGDRFTPLLTGVGPVEAAIVLTRALDHLEMKNHMPDLVVSLGSAGARHLEQTGIYQAVSVSYRDMDASPLGFEKGKTPFVEGPVDMPLPYRIGGIAEARLSTGANIVSGAAYDAIDADMVDMETFALLRVCQSFSLPLIALRGISDGEKELGHVDDWTQYLHIIDEKLATAVDQLEEDLVAGRLL